EQHAAAPIQGVRANDGRAARSLRPPVTSTRPDRSSSALALFVAASVAIAFADSSVVVLALPQLYVRFHTTIEGVAWVVTTYNVAVGVAALGLLAFVCGLSGTAGVGGGIWGFGAGASTWLLDVRMGC